jgi:hypothetical protein
MRSVQFDAKDDGFHFTTMTDRWWETETCWFSFHHRERRLGGWIYLLVRPNIGTVAGGAWIWDASANLPWEVLYCSNYSALRLPKEQDLTDITLPTGVAVRMLKPLESYSVRYADKERLTVDLQFDAVMPPHPLTSASSGFGHLNHFDQIGRVHGTILLYGHAITIDCLSMRDRSWGPRPEHRPRASVYATGVAAPGHGFLTVTNPTEGDNVTHGFLLRDGIVADLKEGKRVAERDPKTGLVSKLVIEGMDRNGRRFQALGVPRSRIVINRHSFIDNNTLVEWTMDTGATAWGEDQDCWPVHLWSEYVRNIRTKSYD